MPIRVRYNNDPSQECTLRPSPLASISTNILKNGAGDAFGVNYTITLNGTLIAEEGSPYAFDQQGNRYPFYSFSGPTPTQVGPYASFDNNRSHFDSNRPPRQQVSAREALDAIESKQKAIRALFAKDGQRLEITDWNDDQATVVCYPRVLDISFEEGIYVDTVNFSITLEADTLLNDGGLVDTEGSIIAKDNLPREGKTEAELLESLEGAFIADFSEDWSVELEESVGESPDLPRSYRITHNLSATGKTHYKPDNEKLPAWQQARNFITHRLTDPASLSGQYLNIPGLIGSGSLDLIESYRGFNHTRTEQVSESNGTYSITETYLIASGTAYENYNMSISSSNSSPYISVTIDGNIKGLSQINASGYGLSSVTSAYEEALNKYHKVTNSGVFGVGSDVFKRANNSVAVQLNSQPLSTAISTNQYTGDITYNIQFDNRPTNIISGVLTENISVNDTYPGDVFAVIPVIGRATGPVIQYIGGRTEYRRDVTIDLLLDYPKLSYGSNRADLLLRKPSVVEPTATQLGNLINELSPANEVGVRKYFLSPPQESWNPKEGSYNISLSWTYELDK
jgi:hypothetical protein